MLYGRYTKEIKVERFSREQSIQFLKEGFREHGITPSQEVLEEAVGVFDGIVGWLVYYGKNYLERRGSIDEIKEMAIKTAKKELEKLEKRERLILKAVANGAGSWGEVKRYLEEKEGITVPKSSLSRVIKKLEKLSIIKQYDFLDPVYKRAAKQLH